MEPSPRSEEKYKQQTIYVSMQCWQLERMEETQRNAGKRLKSCNYREVSITASSLAVLFLALSAHMSIASNISSLRSPRMMRSQFHGTSYLMILVDVSWWTYSSGSGPTKFFSAALRMAFAVFLRLRLKPQLYEVDVDSAVEGGVG